MDKLNVVIDKQIIKEAIKELKKHKELQYIAAIIENLANEVLCTECAGSGKKNICLDQTYKCFKCGGSGKKYEDI